MKKEFVITRINAKDSPMLNDLCKLRDGLSANHNDTTSSERFREFMNKHLGEETMLTFLIFDDDQPIGYGLAFDVAEHAYMPEWTRKGYITQFFVSAAYRGQGIGEMGLAYIHDWFRARGITDVLLNVAIKNEVGNRFWQKNGYTPYATRMICRLK